MATKSLGQLTIDLIARVGGFTGGLSKAERDADQWKKKVKKHVGEVGQAFALTAGATQAALTAITVSTVNTATEVTRLSALANTGTTEFQKYASAAKVVGVEQDKLADIFKDTNDKIGDFIQTGGGPLQDFFDNIAPQVGVTVEQFKRLSGPEALGLYVSSLEKAGASQNEMTFYMEAIASDATLLLPLLRNNAEGFRLLGGEAERAGAILDEDAIKSANELNAAMHLMQLGVGGIKTEIGTELVPVMATFAEELLSVSVGGTLAEDVAGTLAQTLKLLGLAAIGAFGGLQLVGRGVAGLAALKSAATDGGEWYESILPPMFIKRFIGNWDKFKATAGEVADDLEATADQYAELIQRIYAGGEREGDDAEALRERLQFISGLLTDFRNNAGGAGSSGEIDATTQKLIDQAAVLESQNQLLRLGYELEDAKFIAAYQHADEMTQALMAQERQQRAILDAKSEEQELLDAFSAANDERIAEQIDANRSFWDEYLLAAEEALTQVDELALSTIENMSSGFGNALESIVFDFTNVSDAFDQLMETLARSTVNALGKMAAEWLAYQAVQLLVGSAGQAGAVAAVSSEAQTGVLLAGIHAYSSTAAIPVVGPAAAPAAMQQAISVTSPLASAAAAAAAAGYAGAFDNGGHIPAGSFGLVGEKRAEFVMGPADVISGQKTQAVLDRVANDRAANDASAAVAPVVVYINGVAQPVDIDMIRNGAREVVIEEVSNKASKTMRSLKAQTNVRPKGKY